MSSVQKLKIRRLVKRKARVRAVVRGSTNRPRLSVFRSGKNIYVQVIDDTVGCTLVAAGSQDKTVRSEFKHGGSVKAAATVGKLIAEKARQKGITEVAFDRQGYRYHGRVKALAEAAREGGLKL